MGNRPEFELERARLLAEHNDLTARIAELKAILADEKLLLGVIRKEITVSVS